MIAKCIAILAIVAQINASGCGQCSVVLNSYGSGSSSGPSNSGVTRNIVAKGKYPVALNNCGPTPDQQIPVTTSSVTTPVQERPTVRLPATIPAPRTISHSCTCYKTILRPRVHQQIITVPSLQRYVETTHKPVIENIQYEALPVNCEGSSSGSCSGSTSGSSSQIQVVEAQRFQVVEAPRVQAVEIPRVQAIEIPRVQAIEIPRVQTFEIPRVQAVEIPRVQAVEIPRVQAVEIPRVQAIEIPRVQAVEIPRVQVVEAPRVEIPQTFSLGSSSCSSCSY